MCGIFCAVTFKSESLSEKSVYQSIQSMEHRGPDSLGVTIHKNVGLAQCRLAILDLSSKGEQPMRDRENNSDLIFNGEIYNFKEIRQELEKLNVTFESNSDTEVVLKSINIWGANAFKKFNGMFSIIYYNETSSTLLIARDRYGIKPLYWSFRKNQLVFSSEIRAIKKFFEKDKELKWTINSQSLDEYMIYQNIISDESIFEYISMFPAGHYAEIQTTDYKKIVFKKFWEWQFYNSNLRKSTLDDEVIIENMLQKSVRRQLVGDVKIGALLSGGVDSSLITYYAHEFLKNIETFTIGFENMESDTNFNDMDELSHAVKFAADHGLDHYFLKLKNDDFLDSIPKIVTILEEPRMGQSYPNFFANKLASREVKVLLAGTGGDEIFGGYPWRYFINEHLDNWKDFIRYKFHASHKILSEEELLKIYFLDNNRDLNAHFEKFKLFFAPFTSEEMNYENKINANLQFDTNTFLKGLLTVEDKLGMNFSIETRFPFLDNDLVDFATRIPANKKVNLRRHTKNEGKLILRKIVNKNMGSEIANRKKQGFSGPDESWFRSEKANNLIKSQMDRNLPIWQYLNFSETNKIIESHQYKKTNRRLFIWSFLYLSFFLEQNNV